MLLVESGNYGVATESPKKLKKHLQIKLDKKGGFGQVTPPTKSPDYLEATGALNFIASSSAH